MKPPFFRSIQAWLLLLVLLSVLPPVGIFLYSAWDSVDEDLKEGQADVVRMLRGFAFEHESAVASTRQLLITLSRLPDVRNMNLRVTDAIFRDLLKRNPLYANIFLLDAEGMLVSSAEPFTPVSLAKRKYFQDVLRTMDFAVGEQVVGVTLKRPSFHFAYPISDGDGRFKGAVGVAIDLGRYGERFSIAELPEGSSFTLTDHRAVVLFHYPDGGQYIGRSDQPEMAERMKGPGGDEGIFTGVGFDRTRRYYAYKRFHLESGGPAYLHMRAGIPEEKILANVRQTVTISALLLGCALFISLLSSWFIGRSVIVRRLRLLVEAADRLGQGDLAKRTGLPHGRDELGELARSFDMMAAMVEAEERQERRSREAAERLAAEMSVIAELGRIIGSTLEIDEVYERFAAEALNLIPFDWLAVTLHNPEDEFATLAYVFGDIPGRRVGDTFPYAGSMSGFLSQTRTGMIFRPGRNGEGDDRFPGLIVAIRAGMRSFMAVPLFSRDEVIGSLHFRSRNPDAYGETDLGLAERIGAQIAGAIASSRLFAELGRTEKSLRESEGEFRLLLDNAPDAIFIQIGGIIAYLNQKAVAYFGAKSAGELLGQPLIERIHPDDREALQQRLWRLNEKREAVPTMEQKYIKLDGSVIDVEASAVPITFGNREASLSFVRDITDRKRMEAEIREISLRDQMTELYNRRGFITLAGQQLLAANRNQKPMLLIFLDCDGLKSINDTLGHEMGDRALIDTAHLLRQTFREADIIARLGGDEFAVLSIDAAERHPEEMLNRFTQNVALFNATSGRPYALSISCGTAVYDPRAPRSLDELMSAADELMYAQKRKKARREM